MKVICIDASIGKLTGDVPSFKEGDVLTAVQSGWPHSYIILEYEYYKYPIKKSWKKYRFIPLSEIDETEFVREKSLVNH